MASSLGSIVLFGLLFALGGQLRSVDWPDSRGPGAPDVRVDGDEPLRHGSDGTPRRGARALLPLDVLFPEAARTGERRPGPSPRRESPRRGLLRADTPPRRAGGGEQIVQVGGPVSGGAPPVPVPAPQPEPAPEPGPSPGPNPKPDPKPKPEPDPKPDPEPEPEPAKARPKPKPKPKPQAPPPPATPAHAGKPKHAHKPKHGNPHAGPPNARPPSAKHHSAAPRGRGPKGQGSGGGHGKGHGSHK